MSEYGKKKLRRSISSFKAQKWILGSKMMSHGKKVISKVIRIFHSQVKKVKQIQNFPDFFWQGFTVLWAKILQLLQRKKLFQILGIKNWKQKFFSWVVVFNFMLLILYQKVLWHHKMCLDSKISSQKVSEDTLKLVAQSLCYKSTKKIEKISWFSPNGQISTTKTWRVG